MLEVGWVGVGDGPCDLRVSPSPFGLDFGTLDLGLTIVPLIEIEMTAICHNLVKFSRFLCTFSLFCYSFAEDDILCRLVCILYLTKGHCLNKHDHAMGLRLARVKLKHILSLESLSSRLRLPYLIL